VTLTGSWTGDTVCILHIGPTFINTNSLLYWICKYSISGWRLFWYEH